MYSSDTIAAPATGQYLSAIAIIRVTGKEAIEVTQRIFSKNILEAKGYTLHFGTIQDYAVIIDEVLVSVFRAPTSYTGENMTEISCHGSPYVVNEILRLLTEKGARIANPGEFTQRAFLNGKLDLSQAEAVADLIAADSQAGHAAAIGQMKGGYSTLMKDLRQQLLDFASLIELELDFSEEDVEFADRKSLFTFIHKLKNTISDLSASFQYGNVLKNGIATAIIGKPNAGKSTLLNALLKEDRAIVSDVEGTTRDTIEERFVLDGLVFRLIDTAGIRKAESDIEAIGIKKTFEVAEKAEVILYVFDSTTTSIADIQEVITLLEKYSAKLLLVANKTDIANSRKLQEMAEYFPGLVLVSSKNGAIDSLVKSLIKVPELLKYGASSAITVTNVRHYEALRQAFTALTAVEKGLQSHISGELVSQDLRDALYHLGTITGQVSNDELLGNIFSRFCIGK